MGSIIIRLILALCITAFLGACSAKKSIIVLMPDPDGKTGAIEIRNQGGSQKLDAPNQATEVQSSQTAPDPPRILTEAEAQKLFGEVMAAMPPAPVHYTLYFLTDSTRLTEMSTRTFEEALASIGKINPAVISVVGHTDRVGDRAQNFRLGLERANQVKQMFSQRGIDSQIVETTSHGEDNPLIKTPDEVAEPRNRRVEIIVR